MPPLTIRLLGEITVRREDQSILDHFAAKELGLLAYLIMMSDRAQHREVLAGLFWPEKPEEKARHNLAQIIYSLRRKVDFSSEQPFLLSERYTIALHPEAEFDVDLVHFKAALQTVTRHGHDSLSQCELCRKTMSEAAAIYQGPFMQGFTLSRCDAFEEWILVQRERLQREAVKILQRLVTSHEAINKLETALAYAERWASLVPWQEAAHRNVMRLLALSGRRSEALIYFDRCTRQLRDELHVEPHESINWLMHDIRSGRIRPIAEHTTLVSLDLPSIAREKTSPRYPFLGRRRQLDELDQRLESALAGEGQVVFVTGEAGSGKTALLSQFSLESHKLNPDLLIVWGKGNAFVGTGDPYLPFRQVLNLLTGAVRQGYESGLLNTDQAQRLWQALPLAMEALADLAPDLIDAFLPGIDLLARASQAVEGEPGWLAALRYQHEHSQERALRIDRNQLQEQTLAFLRALSVRRPLLFILDDLHWIDTDSVSLLLHLARSLQGMRLLIVGAYRQEEVEIGRDGRIHPMKLLIAECLRFPNYSRLDLNDLPESEHRVFLNTLIDSERNDLGAAFRQDLFDRTHGHALFTVEMLHEYRARGVISWDEQRGWIQRHIVPGSMPVRVEGVIEVRVSRLDTDMQDLLTVAAVEGETFSVQTLAMALDRQVVEVSFCLSSELERKHQLVTEVGRIEIGKAILERFRFRHTLFRHHLYNRLNEAEQRHWHARVGSILELQCGDSSRQIALQLARHFTLAHEHEKAITYWLQSGDDARVLFAYEQAEEAYHQALALAEELDDKEQTARILMRLGLTQHNAGDFARSQHTYAEGFRRWSQVDVSNKMLYSPASRPLRLIWGLGPRNVDPTFDYVSHIFSGLVSETPELEIVPDVAHRWEIDDDGRRYLFHLRDDVFWSDGQPLTAHDFAFAWQHNRPPTPGQPLYGVRGGKMLDFGIITDLQQAQIEVSDPHTLVVNLAQPAVYFLHLLAHPLAGPKPRHIVARYGDSWATPDHIVCNGPFMPVGCDTETLNFSRNPYYHGNYGGNITNVQAQYLRQSTSWQALLELYEQDRIDCQQIFNWGGEGFSTAKRRHMNEYVHAPMPTCTFYCFDTRRAPFNDVRVRQAFVLALDRIDTNTAGMPDTDTLARGGLIPPGMPGHSPEIGLLFDPDRAAQLIAAAGYEGGVGMPEVQLAVLSSPSAHLLTKPLQVQYGRQLNVSIQSEILEWSAYWRTVQQNRPHMMMMTSAATYGDPDAFMRQSYRIIQKLTGWHNDEYSRLIGRAGRALDQNERINLYKQADVLLVDQAVILPLVYQDQAWLVKPWVTHFPLSPTAVGAKWKDVILEV